jgi:tetratricopeptide (TPR) repeat protein
LRPNDAALVGRLGNAQIDHGQLDSGFANLATSVRLDPRSPEGLSRVGYTFLRYRRYGDAAAIADQYLALSPSTADAYDLKITLAMKSRGDTALARQTLALARTKVTKMSRSLASDAIEIGPAEREWFATLTPADLGLTQVFDSVNYYLNKAALFTGRNPARAQAYIDSVLVIVTARPLTGHLAFAQHAVLANAYATVGRKADAEREITAVKAHIATMPNPAGYEAAELSEGMAEDYALLSNADSAVAMIRRVLILPTGISRPYLPVTPVYAPIRSAPSFQAVVAGH